MTLGFVSGADTNAIPISAEPLENRALLVLGNHCLECHGGKTTRAGFDLSSRGALMKGGERGAAIIAGKPAESLLYQKITHTADPPMPFKRSKLPDEDIALLGEWIRAGAPYSQPLLTEKERIHWSLRPLAKPGLPDVKDALWGHSPIDRFILAKLEEKGLTHRAPADKPTLLRRVYFDLTGLPPTPEQQAAFALDTSPEAFAKVVGSLLASPRYGERWARHWLDVAHYADTHGHDQDAIRENAWPYRDYLIAAFNADKPYARFVGDQLAADVLHPEDGAAIAALGFIAAGPWDESTLKDIREDTIDRQMGRYIDRDDMVNTTMSTFASTTAQCARCHDHKFDPITQVEYYNLQAVFAGTDRADRAFDPDPAVKKKSLVYAGTNDFTPIGSHKPAATPRPVHVLQRGDINKPGAAASPGGLSCVPGVPSHFEIADPDEEGQRRAALAKWLTHPDNTLTWRSIVNRVWHYHFGRGIVDSPNDFGRMGSLPTHPELLDWLAVTFRDGGGSLKQLHRLILNSATWQQSSAHDEKSAERDAGNTLLWRMNRTRLDAESIRDAVLQISGQLDLTMGGPPVRQFSLKPGIHVTPLIDYADFDIDSTGGRRRSIYRLIFRTLPDPFMDAMDCADASQLTSRRNESITALQALAMLNNRFMVRQSEHFAERMARMEKNLPEQIAAAWQLAQGRAPSPTESAALTTYAQRHGLANTCRWILNSNEFIFVN